MKNRFAEKVNQGGPVKSLAALVMVVACLCLGVASTAARVGGRPQPASTFQQEQDSRAAQQAEALAARQRAAQKYFTDVVLVNQHGEKVRLYSDLLKDKVVVINFFFATCQGSCLPMGRNMQKVQDLLGDRLGKDVHIISISVDPTVDTAASLKEYAKKVGARPGWHFITGDKASVDFALQKLGQYVESRENHTNIFIIGNERTGLWKKAFGLAKSDDLNKVVESVLNDQPTGGK